MSASAHEFTSLINKLNRFAAEMQAKSDHINRNLEAAAATAETPEFTITVNNGQILELAFTDRANSTSLVQLRDKVLDQYRQAAARASSGTARALAAAGETSAAEAVRETAAGEVGEPDERDAERPDPDGTAAPSVPDVAEVTTTLEELWADPTLEDEIVTGSTPDEIMADVEDWQQYRPSGNPDNWQYELEQELSSVMGQADQLQSALRELTAEAESKLITLEVKGAGMLSDIRFRPAAQNVTAEQLTKEFSQLYQQARADLNEQAMEILGANRAPDDPTMALLGQQRDAAREAGDPPSDDLGRR